MSLDSGKQEKKLLFLGVNCKTWLLSFMFGNADSFSSSFKHYCNCASNVLFVISNWTRTINFWQQPLPSHRIKRDQCQHTHHKNHTIFFSFQYTICVSFYWLFFVLVCVNCFSTEQRCCDWYTTKNAVYKAFPYKIHE